MAAVIGRLSQYSPNLVYDKSGKVQPVGTGVARTFKTEEYEAYFQDSWHVRPGLTLNYGLHWNTSTPVYEANGFQVSPHPGLGENVGRRVLGSATGVPLNKL